MKSKLFKRATAALASIACLAGGIGFANASYKMDLDTSGSNAALERISLDGYFNAGSTSATNGIPAAAKGLRIGDVSAAATEVDKCLIWHNYAYMMSDDCAQRFASTVQSGKGYTTGVRNDIRPQSEFGQTAMVYYKYGIYYGLNNYTKNENSYYGDDWTVKNAAGSYETGDLTYTVQYCAPTKGVADNVDPDHSWLNKNGNLCGNITKKGTMNGFNVNADDDYPRKVCVEDQWTGKGYGVSTQESGKDCVVKGSVLGEGQKIVAPSRNVLSGVNGTLHVGTAGGYCLDIDGCPSRGTSTTYSTVKTVPRNKLIDASAYSGSSNLPYTSMDNTDGGTALVNDNGSYVQGQAVAFSLNDICDGRNSNGGQPTWWPSGTYELIETTLQGKKSNTYYTDGNKSMNGFTISGKIGCDHKDHSALNLSYDGNGATSGKINKQTKENENPATFNVKKNVSQNGDTEFKRPGYKFLGWGDQRTDTTPDYPADNPGTIRITQDTTLYAVWKKMNTYVPQEVPVDEDGNKIPNQDPKPCSTTGIVPGDAYDINNIDGRGTWCTHDIPGYEPTKDPVPDHTKTEYPELDHDQSGHVPSNEPQNDKTTIDVPRVYKKKYNVVVKYTYDGDDNKPHWVDKNGNTVDQNYSEPVTHTVDGKNTDVFHRNDHWVFDSVGKVSVPGYHYISTDPHLQFLIPDNVTFEKGTGTFTIDDFKTD